MTSRGRRLLLLAAGLYLVSWGFGTPVLFPVAVGLVLAPLGALAWVKALDRPMLLRRRTGHLELTEGQSIDVGLEVRPETGGPMPGRAVMVDRIGATRVEAEVERRGRIMRGRYQVASAPRGRYRLDGAELLIADPFGLAEARIPMERADQMLVYPRVYDLEGLFTDGGTPGGDHGRSMLHRTAGYDLHSIREHQQGESLRRVHWRSTARRRRLMVKELQDTPRDEACVVLDGEAASVSGTSPDTTFDVQVRAAASLLRRMSDAGQRSSLVIHAAQRSRHRLGFGSGDWAAVLGELAGAEATAPTSLAEFLASAGRGPDPVDAARLFVVTASMSAALAERVLGLSSGQCEPAVVWIDAASFGGRTRTLATGPEAAALRLTRSGIAVARIRDGDHVGRALSAPVLRLVVARG
ncbi:MAG TPA: DUF58 domain-containing protein [Gaiellales bacterium]|jgi:uncharacterized protein (DUF58 family)